MLKIFEKLFKKKKKKKKNENDILHAGVILALMNLEQADKAEDDLERDACIDRAKRYLTTAFNEYCAKKSDSK